MSKSFKPKFRCWNINLKRWEPKMGLYFDDGTIGDFSECFHNQYDCTGWTLQQSTGLTSDSKREIYEGDIVEFEYRVGDFAWEMLNIEEIEEQTKLQGKTFVGVVSRELLAPINMNIVVGNPKSTHIMFPIEYALGAKILGNVLENPELIK